MVRVFAGDDMDSRVKIPGMAYILLSFLPWIAYWILSGLESGLCIAVPLAIAVLLTAPQAARRELNLMDAWSLLYFMVASVGTYILNTSVFIDESGLLGYTALFIMAVLSLILRKPYTLQVSKRDYPEIYWRQREFLLINNVITVAWAAIFLANASIFLLIGGIFAVILSNILITAGITFSIMFPLYAPAYFVTRRFKKYDWKVKIDPRRPKGEHEYDVIIVGSGIGGLTCGALLSKRGYKVLVLEQHYQAGGYCSSFKRGGFTFNTGVENVSGLWERGPITHLLRELGLRREDLFVRNRMRYIFKGRIIDASRMEDLIRALSEMFPREKDRIHAFFEEARKAYEECYMDTETYGVPLPAELIVKVFGRKKLLNYPMEHPHFYNWMNKTYKQKLDEYFEDTDLKEALCALLGYIGTRPEETPASAALTAVVSYYIHGGYFPRGGAQRFSNTLKGYIESHGGRILLKRRVDRILVEKGKVKGVKAGGKIYRSLVVVANANAKTTFLELVGEENLDRRFVEYIKALEMSPSCFMVSLGVDMDLSEYPTIIENLDEGYSIVINSNADPDLAPKGKASVTILTGANYYDFPERGTEAYVEKKRKLTETLIRKAEKAIPGLAKHIIVQDAATPRTFERYTSMPEGAIYSFNQSINVRRPYFKTPIKGLYLASASTFPGGGIEAVVISGTICANDICGWKTESDKQPKPRSS